MIIPFFRVFPRIQHQQRREFDRKFARRNNAYNCESRQGTALTDSGEAGEIRGGQENCMSPLKTVIYDQTASLQTVEFDGRGISMPPRLTICDDDRLDTGSVRRSAGRIEAASRADVPIIQGRF
jgi:hypothetical protein